MSLLSTGRMFAYIIGLSGTFLMIFIVFSWMFGYASVIPIIGKWPLGSEHLSDKVIPLFIVVLTLWILIMYILASYFLELERKFLIALGEAVNLKDENERRNSIDSLFVTFSDNNVGIPLLDAAILNGRAAHRVRLMQKGYIAFWANPHNTLTSVAELDATALPNTYSFLHALIWTIPVLGFIGTAIGLSASIGSFQNILEHQENLSDTTLLLNLVGKTVIKELAGAFANTVFALITASICYICINALESFDNELLNTLDRVSDKFLLYSPDQAGQLHFEFEKTQTQVILSLDSRFGALQASIEALIGSLRGLEGVSANINLSMGQIMSIADALKISARSIEETLNSSALVGKTAQLQAVMAELSASIREVREAAAMPVKMVFQRENQK